MDDAEFRDWLGRVSGMSESERRQLTKSRFAERFLITWHLFEAKCFERECHQQRFRDFSKRYLKATEFDLEIEFSHFHARYPDPEKLRQLLHGATRQDVKAILGVQASAVPNEDRVYLLVAVVHRYRNNMFHGNKGLHSWLNYKEQIEHCIHCMQRFVEVASEPPPQ